MPKFGAKLKKGGINTKMSKDTEKTLVQDNLISSHERKVLEIIRNLDFGEVRIVITDGKPTRIEEIKKSIKL